jgi:hypothetical protein
MRYVPDDTPTRGSRRLTEYLPCSLPAPCPVVQSPALRLMRVLRVQLSHMKAFIYTCRKKDQLLRMFGTRTYMLHDLPFETPLNPHAGAPISSQPPVATPLGGGGGAAADAKAELKHSSRPGSAAASTSNSPLASPRISGASASANAGAGAAAAAAAVSPLREAASRPLLNDLYSLRDLLEVVEADLATRLHQVTRAVIAHISSGICEGCSSKAHICELCTDRAPIYPFQLAKTIACGQCHAVFHRKCFDPKTRACPKCVRLAKRRR